MANNLTSNFVESVNRYGHNNLSHASVYFLFLYSVERHTSRQIYWAETQRAQAQEHDELVGGVETWAFGQRGGGDA